ncbi:uncharacterized protein (DUF4415 family) [Cupriavidus gilardii J11]|uniref:Uncharacterized protein (DUF4415 family) n=1 Tax=Cupriavidus gilardii J11 TaxID=936133 RepID=A0A562BP39_9BURK|nr:BrnA antitoxin family protein [Cupriavidus gilardii]TWG86680.1 uncharacterized protein (DUF4415 family) [Cupriavidus gilardii J11]
MANRKPLTDPRGEVRELDRADFADAKPLASLPESLRRKIGQRGPQKAPTKERITIRLSPEVVQSFRETGNGWQARIDNALKDWLKSHRPA